MKAFHPLRRKQIRNALFLSSFYFIPAISLADNAQPIFTDQGEKWTEVERRAFYSQDQGSELIPLKWLQALKQSNGELFLADSLKRYGYLANPVSPTPGLPVGFTVTNNTEVAGMTCSACHVREIKVDDQAYRIDGGPAIVDFQSFVTDLDKAVQATLKNDKQFKDFAKSVLGDNATDNQQADLRKQVIAWDLPFSTIMQKALPKDKPWGPARLDAVGMIFNRLTGLDIGTSDNHIIANNIHLADAPVRYPFLWNAPIQDKTQWPGFADNGNMILALSRNLGEVIGVFAHFNPIKSDWRVLGYDYLSQNSANFDGLKKQEEHIKNLGAPKWPWLEGKYAIDKELANKGKDIFASTTQTEEGGCVACHGIRDGAMRSFEKTWATPICDVQTDQHQFTLFTWQVDTGVLNGAQIPFLEKPLAKKDTAFGALSTVVLGSILQHETNLVFDIETAAEKEFSAFEKMLGASTKQKIQAKVEELRNHQAKLVTDETNVLQGAFHSRSKSKNVAKASNSICQDKFNDTNPKRAAFESRVLEGIWATAPYLHNGSVPSLEDLLKPVAERPATFKVGQAYDPRKVGLAAEQTQFDYHYKTTDCKDTNSGNSRCGHEFGTKLSDPDKKALLEFLKQL